MPVDTEDSATVESTSAIVPLYAFSRRLPYLPFVNFAGSWKTCGDDSRAYSLKRSARGSSSLRIATWNVWFEATLRELRYEVLLDILLSKPVSPPLICDVLRQILSRRDPISSQIPQALPSLVPEQRRHHLSPRSDLFIRTSPPFSSTRPDRRMDHQQIGLTAAFNGDLVWHHHPR